MRTEYRARVERKGLGRDFHSLKGEEVDYVNDLVAWVNERAELMGRERVEGHSRRWLEENKWRFLKMKRMFVDEDGGLNHAPGEEKFKGQWREWEERSRKWEGKSEEVVGA